MGSCVVHENHCMSLLFLSEFIFGKELLVLRTLIAVALVHTSLMTIIEGVVFN